MTVTGGTLMVSRDVNNQRHIKQRLEDLGFDNVCVTAHDRDALHSLIRDMKPDILMMGAKFYDYSTPYMMGELKKKFPKIKMAALSLERYPEDLAMNFIVNGIQSYITAFEGIEVWRKGLDEIKKGKQYVAASVQKRIDLREEYPMAAATITKIQTEVLRLSCCGYLEDEITAVLQISRRTLDTHKKNIHRSLNVRNYAEMVRAAYATGIVNPDVVNFSAGDMILPPRPKKLTINN